MMKWGRKKSSSSSLNSPIGRVFPMSWISRFKKMSGSTKSNSAKNTKTKERENSPFQDFQPPTSWTEGQFHGENEESYWRLSFGEEKCGGEKIGGVLKSVWYDSDDELEVRILSPQRSRAREQNHKFSNVIPGRRKIREFPRNVEILQGNDACKGGQESEKFKVLRRRALEDIKSRKSQQREEKCPELPSELDKAVENSTKDILELKSEKDYGKSTASGLQKQRGSSNSRRFQEDVAFETPKLEQDKSEEQRKSALICRESPRKRNKQRRKVRVYTPRTAARIECKIRALEDLKKAKMKTKKATKERSGKGATAFDSFAVVKSSINPQEDFENSMVEMITAQGIRHPQELEELLACYLTLNCDEYHDMIIQVFRQVWFELNQIHFDPAIQSEHCCNLQG